MRTSAEYQKNVKKVVITPTMFGEIVYSYNKRAKNMRDQAWYYRHTKYFTGYRLKKDEYYKKKDALLKFATPTEIHKVERVRAYYGGDCHEETITEYFLYYRIGTYSFHHPIHTNELSKYDLPIKELSDLTTEGKDVDELLSVQFCDKVLNGLILGNYKLVA